MIVMGLAASGCTGFDLLNAPISSLGYTRTTDIAYGTKPRQSLDVYRPRDAKPNARVIVFFYGGEWSAGKKANYRFAADALTSKGFVVVLPDYRLYPQVTFPAFVEDGARAIRWTHDNIARFGGDPTHIYLMGHSAGAQIAALLTLDRHYLQEVGLDTHVIRATAAMSGPYFFLPSPDDRPIFKMGPKDVTPDPRIEPIYYARKDAPPMLLLHGAQDKLVDVKEAEQLRA